MPCVPGENACMWGTPSSLIVSYLVFSGQNALHWWKVAH